MNRFVKKETLKFNIADNFLPVSGQHVEYFVTDYALATDEFLDHFFPSLFKNGKLNKKVKMQIICEK